MATKTKAAAAPKPAPNKGKPAGASAPAEAPRENRYLRAARVIIKAGEGEGIDPMRIVAEGKMSAATAGHAIEAFKGVTQALREAGILPVKPGTGRQARVEAQEGAEAA